MSSVNATSQSASPREGLLARHPLVFYFLIAYAGSWLVWMLLVLSEDGAGLLPFSSPLLAAAAIPVGVFMGPTLSAFIMTDIAEGRAGLHRLLLRYVLWRTRIQWYLFALIGIPAILVLGAIVLPGALSSYQGLPLCPC